MKQSPTAHRLTKRSPTTQNQSDDSSPRASGVESLAELVKHHKHRWKRLPASYRNSEVVQVAEWIRLGVSGCVVGLAESGRSNLLTFLTHRGDVLQSYLAAESQVVLIPVDIFNLPDNNLACLYRTILHAFYWARDRIDPELHRYATELYIENRYIQDPFPPQMALYDLLRAFEDADVRVVLILNRFDRFCATATPQMLNTLRGVRDTFKGTLSYIVGMLQEVVYLTDGASLGDLYDILDRHICWVGSMTVEDARAMLFRDVLRSDQRPSDEDIAIILRLSGLFPGLLKTVGFWWVEQMPLESDTAFRLEHCKLALMEEPSMQFRLERIWNCLTQEEQLVLSELQKIESDLPIGTNPLEKIRANLAASGNGSSSALPHVQVELNDGNIVVNRSLQKQIDLLTKQHEFTLTRLETKGLCEKIDSVWWIKSSLLSAFVETQKGRAKGRVWLDEKTKQIHQGQNLLQELPGLQHEILSFLIRNPRIRHTNDDIINSAWPDDEQREGISDNALQVHIRGIRKRVEPNPAKPNYLVTWRGNPGGYIFYPEGRPD